MATEKEIEELVDGFNEDIADIADNTARFSQEESAEIYESVGQACMDRARLIRSEMG